MAGNSKDAFSLPLKSGSEPAVVTATSTLALSLCGATASLTSFPLTSNSVASSSATTVSITSAPLISAPFISGPLSTPVATKPISCNGTSPNLSPVSGKSPPYKKLLVKNDCQGCPMQRTVNENLKLANIRLRLKQREQAREYHIALSKCSAGRVSQALKRKDKSVQKWKTKCQTIKMQKDKVDNLQKLSTAYEATLEAVMKSNKKMAARITELETTNVEMSAELIKLQKKYHELNGKYTQLQNISEADNNESL